jgi:hypothetical protein
VHAILYFDRNGNQHNHLTFEDIPQALEDQQGLLRVDFEGEPPEVCEPVFGMNFFEPVLSTSAWTGGSALVLPLLLMVAAPSLMYLYIRKRGWI